MNKRKVEHFEDLLVWQQSQSMAIEIYRITSSDKFSRDFALRDQLRRATISVMSNIAEGFERYSRNEFRQYLSISRGSLAEARSQITLAMNLGYISAKECTELRDRCIELSHRIGALRTSLGG